MDNIDNIQSNYEDYFQRELDSRYDNYKNGESEGLHEFIFAYMTSPDAQEHLKEEVMDMLVSKYPGEDHLIDAIWDSIDYDKMHKKLKEYCKTLSPEPGLQ